jgi:hypothetical protein
MCCIRQYLLGIERGVNRAGHFNRISTISTKDTSCSYSTSKKSNLTRGTKQEQINGPVDACGGGADSTRAGRSSCAHIGFTSSRFGLPRSIRWPAFRLAKDERGQQREESPCVEGDRGERGGRVHRGFTMTSSSLHHSHCSSKSDRRRKSRSTNRLAFPVP